ncbi:MAG: hypothetical protein K8F54_00225 [Altibacter sp.]|uniref:hypothetical protein n=1 Tax=Altibacter sp. TaxID=2024823 RepID=UPI001E01DF99|nr:hypothetical protein [Altibacter sp.]MBZ0326003.1 hypothetical protein [Altibacter sp.]
MGFLRKVDKVLAAMGNSRAMERLHVDKVTEAKSIEIEGTALASSEQGQLFGGIQELNGYLFLETVIVSGTKIKTFDGGRLTFISDTGNFELPSDTQEIDSEYSNVSRRFMTQISFDITEAEIERIKNKDFTEVHFDWKKKSLRFDRAN